MSNKTLSTSPNQLGSGNLPSGYDEINFRMENGNWTKDLKLPLEPTDKNTVNIISSASYTAYLETTDVVVPLTSLPIRTGSNFTLVYQASISKWSISGTGISYLSPNSVGDTIPEKPDNITFYTLENYNWVTAVTLPAKANDGAYIIIRSSAAWNSKVNTTNMLYASTTNIFTNDVYTFKYLAAFNSWVIDSAPVRTLFADNINVQMPKPTSQFTEVKFTSQHWIELIRLPENPGDRDKVSITSSSIFPTAIDATNVNIPGAMNLYSGEQYDFIYIAENKKWQLMKYPDTRYEAKEIAGGKLGQLTHPRTLIHFSDHNYHYQLELPANQPAGSRVVITSDAAWNFTVLADGTTYPVSNGEIVAFKVDVNNTWSKETITIDLLLLYSDKAAARLGEDTMRNRLVEGFNMTNEALENSGANFRYRMRGLRQVIAKDNWKSLGDPLGELRSDPTVQGWRDSLKADGIYYEGTEDGCGLAWVRSSAFNMVATGSINCGTTVMRHELGHNMGLNHADTGSSYNKGYSLVRSIMGGNAIPYYSTPLRYTQDYGIPMGIVDKIDAVRAMNEFSATVAAYR
ncbi:M12 family metallo-peptidase [Serratia proteamaculans]|uniref:M12 family metallo-peptidase n=1 Tax=Serratia proteamaculans TaxID=28151 RepID=UPI0039AF6B34